MTANVTYNFEGPVALVTGAAMTTLAEARAAASPMPRPSTASSA